MTEITVVYWRDIPAQIIVGKGRNATKAPLSERFEQAIDRCAMKVGAKDADAYLAEWHKAPLPQGDPALLIGSADDIAKRHVEYLENIYDDARLRLLISHNGWENTA